MGPISSSASAVVQNHLRTVSNMKLLGGLNGFNGPNLILSFCCGSKPPWNSIQLFHTFLCNSQNYHPRGAVDDPMQCCPRPKAEGNSASGHPQHRGGDSFDCCTERYEIVVLLPNSEDTCYWKCFLKFE